MRLRTKRKQPTGSRPEPGSAPVGCSRLLLRLYYEGLLNLPAVSDDFGDAAMDEGYFLGCCGSRLRSDRRASKSRPVFSCTSPTLQPAVNLNILSLA